MIDKFLKYQVTLLETNTKLLDSGRRNADRRKYNEALEDFDNALKLNEQIKNRNGVLTALEYKANTLVEKGDLKQALRVYTKVAKLDPTNPVLFDIAYIHGELGQFEESIANYQQYLKFYPDDYAALGNIGWVYEQLNRPQEAERCYKTALTIKPEFLSALNRLVILLDGLAKDDKSKRKDINEYASRALKLYERRIKREPKNPDMLVNKAIALDVLEKKEAAIDVYKEALKIDKNNTFALYNMSCTTALLDRTEESLKLLEKAIQLEPVYRDMAKKDSDFKNLYQNEKFRKLVGLA